MILKAMIILNMLETVLNNYLIKRKKSLANLFISRFWQVNFIQYKKEYQINCKFKTAIRF